ncbi:MAG TPA: START domain-containing protein [Spirochaetota bacterium]|nr:START domain-containing protein [Spirochaetota bacterium]
MKHFKKLSIPLIALLVSFTSGFPASGWETVKEGNGIQLSVRPVPDSQVKEFMAVTVVDSSLSACVALLEDTPNYTQWNYKCIEAKLLQRKNDYERITYMATESPWPVENRDIAVKSVLTQDKKTGIVTIELKGLPDYIPGKEGRVRMASLSGYYKFEPFCSGKVRATYRLRNEPGGSVPESLVNGTVKDIVYNTLWNMRNFVQKNPYKNIHLNYIQEKY